MNKKTQLITSIIATIILLIIAYYYYTNESNTITITFENGKTLQATTAITKEEQTKGLMNKQHLPPNEGMIFIYKKEQQLTFWMKNTPIPLDIIFLDKNKIIIDIQTMQPCTKQGCTFYTSKQPAKYAIETNAKYSITNNLHIGQKVHFKE
jgi:uncharacterized membrane protein (UPF0127 family)